MPKIRNKRITKTQRAKILSSLKKGIKPSVIAKKLKVKNHQVYNLSTYLRKEVINKTTAKVNQRAKLSNQKTYLFKDSLLNGTDKEKVEALIRYLGKEALKTLLDE